MKVKMGYNMGFAGTETEWTEEIPAEVVAEGDDAIEAYLDDLRDSIWNEACEKIEIWANTEE
jgi:hypothetical protein